MTRIEVLPFRKRDFEVAVLVSALDPVLSIEFAEAICRAKPSRLDNVLEIEVSHKADSRIHQTVEMMCDNGVRSLTLKTKHPSAISDDPHAYVEFAYEVGRVIDQWTDMSRRDADGDEFMVDVIKIAFERKTVTNCVWDTEAR